MECRVHIAIPSTNTWLARFGMCLNGLVANFLASPIVGADIQMIRVWNKRGSILPSLREELVQEALKVGATHILFLDSDQTFPPDALRRLLAWRVPVVGCNIVTKSFPCNPTARQKSEEHPEGALVYSMNGMVGLERVWRLGCGVMLLDTCVFNNMPEPWFGMRWAPDKRNFVGEDWIFCESLERAGHWIYVDHGLSLEVGHVGDLEYVHEFCRAEERLLTAMRDGASLRDKMPACIPG